jgi:hypothetical protein
LAFGAGGAAGVGGTANMTVKAPDGAAGAAAATLQSM